MEIIVYKPSHNVQEQEIVTPRTNVESAVKILDASDFVEYWYLKGGEKFTTFPTTKQQWTIPT